MFLGGVAVSSYVVLFSEVCVCVSIDLQSVHSAMIYLLIEARS